MEKGVSLERALEIANHTPMERNPEILALDQATGRILFDDLISLVDDPRFDNSAMDGWAVREADCQETGAVLRIVGTSQAGSAEVPLVGEGEACSIMTGAPVPEGADAIVMVEDSTTDDVNVTINGPARTGYIRRRGENLTEGESPLKSGSLLTPSAISLCATMGHDRLPVVRKPSIAVIGVGDELTPPGEPLSKNSIYESNTFGISSLVKKMG